MFTFLGKLLVFANLVVAVGMATWAAGLYTQRPTWFAYTDGWGEQNPGQFAELKAEIEKLGATAAAEAGRWGVAHRVLQARQTTRA